ncbi:MAG: UDP-N-acetylmuramate dehydrogenase [Candidatus Eisenbacteria bacterium]|nr:UDP-N-acetylmuramate dehydrogenase [Candidatus Eisenbacteria bacterium]MCC7141585.1 UDP-N-acetylmuramate dehydrogenase [Candidatus Eisenbacteria bacterium]
MEPTPCALLEHEPLAPHLFWRIGGPADLYAEPRTEAELLHCLRLARDRRLPVLALGGGSNLLVADGGFRGLAIAYQNQEEDQAIRGDRMRVRIGAGALLAPTGRRLSRLGWAGLEWAEGIPGTLGGAVAGNAGAYGGDIASALHAVEVLADAERFERWNLADCAFGYRKSRFGAIGATSAFISAVTFLLRAEDPERLAARMQAIGQERKAKTPAGLSCGSVFKNPEGASAGRLIEQAGLKGLEEGPAQVSPLHANYIVNRGGATADQVRRLIARIRAAVEKECGIRLEPEVRMIGFDPPQS